MPSPSPQLKTNPTVTQLAARVSNNGAAASPQATGVQLTIGTGTYIVLTYTDNTCTSATAAVGDVGGLRRHHSVTHAGHPAGAIRGGHGARPFALVT